jgi:Rod binding domain-containing protein
MDISNTILTEPVLPPEVLPYVKGVENASDEQKKKIAEDFESLLVGRLLEEMGKTAEEWGDEHEQVFGQVKGIFNLYLSQYIGSNGGFGLAKQIYESLNQMEQKGSSQSETVDKEI